MCIPDIYMGDTQENWVELPQMAQATTLNISSVKDKRVGGAEGEPVMGEYQQNPAKGGQGCYADLSGTFSTDKFLVIYSHPIPPGVERETPPWMESSLKKVNTPCCCCC